jgi:hypothetical protein
VPGEKDRHILILLGSSTCLRSEVRRHK